MTGVYIKGMFMPDSCVRCPLALLDSFGYRRCFVTECDVTNCDGWSGDRPADCPMCEANMEELER